LNRKKLVDTLDIVARGLDNNNVIPVFNYLCFLGETVFTFNDIFGISAPTEKMPAFGCHGPTLLGLLKKSTAEEVDFKLKPDSLVVITGNSEFTLPYIKPEQFVWKPFFLDGPLRLPLVPLIEAFEVCLLTCSKDASLGAFNCISIGKEGMTANIYSHDGDAVTKYATDVSYQSDSECFSREFIEELVRLYEPSEIVQENSNEFLISKEWVCAELLNSVRIYGRSLGKPTLDYEVELSKYLNSNKSGAWDYIPEGLEEALSRARVVGDPETTPTTLSVEDGLLSLLTETNLGNVLDGVEVDPKKTTNIDINISAELFQKNMKDCDQFWLSQNCVFFKGERITRVVANLG
jgi:DNA polymerase III sliding clamp (beta) subunit (PCNA family)